MLLMGVLKQCGIDKKHVTERKRVRYSYVYRNQRVCRQAFQLLYDTKERTLDNIQKHMQSHGCHASVFMQTRGGDRTNAFKFDRIKVSVYVFTLSLKPKAQCELFVTVSSVVQ